MSWWIVKDITVDSPIHVQPWPGTYISAPMLVWENASDASNYLDGLQTAFEEHLGQIADLIVCKLPVFNHWWVIRESKSGELMKPEGYDLKDRSAPILLWDNKWRALDYAGQQVRLVVSLEGELDLTVMPPALAALHSDQIPQP